MQSEEGFLIHWLLINKTWCICGYSLCRIGRIIYHQSLFQLSIHNYPSGAPEFTPSFQWRSSYSIFSFLYNVLYIVVCHFFSFLPLCCLSFFCWQTLITPLVSSFSSHIFLMCVFQLSNRTKSRGKKTYIYDHTYIYIAFVHIIVF